MSDEQINHPNVMNDEFRSINEMLYQSTIDTTTILHDSLSAPAPLDSPLQHDLIRIISAFINTINTQNEYQIQDTTLQTLYTLINMTNILLEQINVEKKQILSLAHSLTKSQLEENWLQQENKAKKVNVQQNCLLFIAEPPQSDDSIIAKFKPKDDGQVALRDDNIQRIISWSGETILHNYCKYVNTTPVGVYRFLIETMGCQINIRDHGKNTPIQLALRMFNPKNGGDINILTYLINQKGVDVNYQGLGGLTLLHEACLNINSLPLHIFQCLIETKKGYINALDDNDNTPIHSAFDTFNQHKGGDPKALMYLLTQKCLDITVKNQHGLNLLHLACRNINALPIDVFKHLIETHGMDINEQDKKQDTPIHFALRQFSANQGGDVNILIYLLHQESIDTTIQNINGLTILHHASFLINVLPVDTFKYLIEVKGGDVNAKDRKNDTSLHHALRSFDPNKSNNINALLYLLSREGINANVKGANQYTLLHHACLKINSLPIEIFKHLIETNQSDVNVLDKNRDTPLFVALREFKPVNSDAKKDCVKDIGNVNSLIYLLRQNSIDINIKDKNSRNLLLLACSHINVLPLETFKYLIETNGAKAIECDKNGFTPLHCLMHSTSSKPDAEVAEMVQYFIDQGVEINKSNYYLETVLDYFLSTRSPRGSPLTYQVLMRNGAKKGGWKP
jgi:hypothetical protein